MEGKNVIKKFNVVLIFVIIFCFGCSESKEKGKKIPLAKGEERELIEEIEVEPITLKFIEKENTQLLSHEETLIKEISIHEIQNSTFKLYVESVPINQNILWQKGNDPRKTERDIEKDNVRAICLGEENDNYVFMTLRFFMDYTYPNPNIQNVIDEKLVISSDSFIDYTKMLRIMISDVRHTGGGQIKVLKTIPFVVKNQFTLEEKKSYDVFSHCSDIDGKKYVNPVKSDLTAIDVKEMMEAIEKKEFAQLETFGNHDICLIKTPKKMWGESKVSHLGLHNPSETIKVLVEKQKYLYGFEFVLISKEAYQAVMQYKIPDEAKESGIYKLIITATELMSPQHVMQIRMVDSLLAKTFTNIKKNTVELLTEDELVSLGIEFGRHFLGYRKKIFGRKK